MPSKEQDVIQQIKIAEQQAEQQIKDAETETAFLIEKAQSDRVRRQEKAKNEARGILKQMIADAKDSSKYKKLISDAEQQSLQITEGIGEKITEVAKKVADYILEIE